MRKILMGRSFRLLIIILILILPGCDYYDSLILTQIEAEKLAGVFCLPTYLPDNIHPTPLFRLKSGDPPFDPTALYTNTITSERAFEITMGNVSSNTHTESDYQYYDRYLNCEWDRFVLSNSFRVCNTTAQIDNVKSDEYALIKGPPFISSLTWLVHRGDKWTVYYLRSSLTLEETKKIASSMVCSE